MNISIGVNMYLITNDDDAFEKTLNIDIEYFFCNLEHSIPKYQQVHYMILYLFAVV